MASVHSLKVSMIGGRTNSSGTAQDDWDQEEMRLGTGMDRRQGMTANLITGAPNPNAFQVRQDTGSNMQVKVGSGTDGADGYILKGTLAGQGAYRVMLDTTTVTLTVPAAHASLLTAYGVYLFVDDTAYSGTASRAYADITVLAGTPHASAPVVPSASATMSAYALLWSFRVGAAGTAVTNVILDSSTAVDARVSSHALGFNVLEAAIFL